MVALVLLFVLLTGLLTSDDDLHRTSDQRDLLGVGGLATIFAALAGILVVTSEYRFGTIRPTFVFTPRRSRVIGAKLVASLARRRTARGRRDRPVVRDRTQRSSPGAESRWRSTEATSR